MIKLKIYEINHKKISNKSAPLLKSQKKKPNILPGFIDINIQA